MRVALKISIAIGESILLRMPGLILLVAINIVPAYIITRMRAARGWHGKRRRVPPAASGSQYICACRRHSSTTPSKTRRPDVVLLDLKGDGGFPSQDRETY